MAKRKILFIVPVEERTYWKWQKTKHKIGEFAPWFISGATIGAAWFGYCNSIRNAIRIDKVVRTMDHNVGILNETIDIVNNNANASRQDRARIEELEKLKEDSKGLYEKALDITEGKVDPAE